MWVFFRKHALQFLRLSLSAHELRARGGAHPSAPGRVRSSSTWWSSVRRRRHGGGGVGSGRGGRQRRGGSSPADVRVRGSAAQEAGSGVKSASVSAAAARGARGGGETAGATGEVHACGGCGGTQRRGAAAAFARRLNVDSPVPPALQSLTGRSPHMSEAGGGATLRRVSSDGNDKSAAGGLRHVARRHAPDAWF